MIQHRRFKALGLGELNYVFYNSDHISNEQSMTCQDACLSEKSGYVIVLILQKFPKPPGLL